MTPEAGGGWVSSVAAEGQTGRLADFSAVHGVLLVFRDLHFPKFVSTCSFSTAVNREWP